MARGLRVRAFLIVATFEQSMHTSHMCISISLSLSLYIYIYISIYRKRKRERERETCVYIYIYICILTTNSYYKCWTFNYLCLYICSCSKRNKHILLKVYPFRVTVSLHGSNASIIVRFERYQLAWLCHRFNFVSSFRCARRYMYIYIIV